MLIPTSEQGETNELSRMPRLVGAELRWRYLLSGPMTVRAGVIALAMAVSLVAGMFGLIQNSIYSPLVVGGAVAVLILQPQFTKMPTR